MTETSISAAWCPEHKCHPNECFDTHYPQAKRGLRLVELYPSVQGEGPLTGTPTTFIRFGGCNMRCPGWPCDTDYAIYPDQWRNSPQVSAQEILDQVVGFTPTNICLTGGEPTMQPSDQLVDLIMMLGDHDYSVEMFTNGSLKALWTVWEDRPASSHIMLDWKLEGSGEQKRGREIRHLNALWLQPRDGIKFVVKDQDDLLEAVDVYNDLRDTRAQFWVGAAWGHIPDVEIIEFVLQRGLPWRLNIQTHKYIWSPTTKGV